MLTAKDISLRLRQSREEGRPLAIISLVEQAEKPAVETLRLLVTDGGTVAGGTLGSPELDEVAARHALRLIADEQQEIATARLSELIASQNPAELDGTIIKRVGDVRLLFEISRPTPELIVCGGGHVGQAVARAGRLLDFQVTVIDDREDFASRDKFPDPQIRLIAADFIEALRSLRITPAAHLVIVTRGHKHDEMCLREVISKPARYIGMIGSRRRTATIRAMLRREGVPVELLQKVHAPVGLDIGAQTPEEIAVAILAEIVLVRRGGTGQPKSEGRRQRAEGGKQAG
ncbi:MAG TPA: XdhC family protein [Blastocatellia bacterium]|nr:XdhC family protein [Blastocatellia bacterium]